MTDTVTAAVLAALALGVGALAKFQGPARWFALFGFGFGASIFLGNFAEAIRLEACGELVVGQCSYRPEHATWLPFFAMGTILLHLVAAVGLIMLGRSYGISSKWYWAGFGFPIWTIVGMSLAFDGMGLWDIDLVAADYFWWAQVYSLWTVLMTYMSVTTFGLAFSYKAKPSRDKAILAAAMVAYPLAQIWTQSFGSPVYPGKFVLAAISALVGPLLLMFVWSRAGRQGEGAPRFVMGVILAFVLLAAISTVWFDGRSIASFARVFDMVLVSYAILRMQYLGIDLKVRWGLSKSTVAAIFIAVFFITSEAASQFFGDRFNNNYIGIAAAGVLVLGIAPLQRFADRVATTAVPGAGAASAADAYRKVLLRYAKDGVISMDEEDDLAELATGLGLTPSDVLQIRRDVLQNQAVSR